MSDIYHCIDFSRDSIRARGREGAVEIVLNSDVGEFDDKSGRGVALTKPDAIAFAFDVLKAAGHAPEAAPVVVEVKRSEIRDAITRSWTGESYDEDTVVRLLNESLRARAADTIACRVVKRPTVTVKGVSSLKTPKECGHEDRSCFIVSVHDGKGVWTGREVANRLSEVRRWSIDGITWIERTQTPDTVTTREWAVDDIPMGDVMTIRPIPGGFAMDHFSPWMERQVVADFANRYDSPSILVLPDPAGVV